MSEMRLIDARREIQKLVGANDSPHSPLRKETYNSVYAYLTGSFYIHPNVVYIPGSPKRADVMEAVHAEAGIEGEFEDRRHMKKDELVQILERIRTSDDKREWAGETQEISF